MIKGELLTEQKKKTFRRQAVVIVVSKLSVNHVLVQALNMIGSGRSSRPPIKGEQDGVGEVDDRQWGERSGGWVRRLVKPASC